MRDYQKGIEWYVNLAKKLDITLEQLLMIEIVTALKDIKAELGLIKLSIPDNR